MNNIKLELRNVAAGYEDKPILRNVNCIIHSGEICCLLGPNGVGKTTLFKTILGLIPPVSGQVLMDGRDTSTWSARQLADNIAYVSQFHNPPFPYKVKDVVLLGRVSQAGYFGKVSELDYEIAQQAIVDMGVAHLADKPYTDISGGERQLVMIARALTQQPKWLMMDEPTASLDYGNMIRVISRIVELRDRGYGIIMTTHLPDQAFMCDAKVGLLQRGSSMKFGDAAEIITEENMREIYGVGVSVAELFDRSGHLMRMCVPEISSSYDLRSSFPSDDDLHPDGSYDSDNSYGSRSSSGSDSNLDSRSSFPSDRINGLFNNDGSNSNSDLLSKYDSSGLSGEYGSPYQANKTWMRKEHAPSTQTPVRDKYQIQTSRSKKPSSRERKHEKSVFSRRSDSRKTSTLRNSRPRSEQPGSRREREHSHRLKHNHSVLKTGRTRPAGYNAEGIRSRSSTEPPRDNARHTQDSFRNHSDVSKRDAFSPAPHSSGESACVNTRHTREPVRDRSGQSMFRNTTNPHQENRISAHQRAHGEDRWKPSGDDYSHSHQPEIHRKHRHPDDERRRRHRRNALQDSEH